MSAWKAAGRGCAIVALQQIALAAVLFLLLVGWLHIPDANALEVVASVLTAVSLALIAGVGESAIALHLSGKPFRWKPLLLGAGIFFVATLLWYALALGLQHLAAQDGMRAGYLNSKLPASLRNLLNYNRLLLWSGWFWSMLKWIVAGLLAAIAFVSVVCDHPLPCVRSILRFRWYWFALLLLAVVQGLITGALLGWTPGHGIRLELLSVVLRLIAVVVLNALAAALLLQAMARAVSQHQLEGAGEPEVSHMRTAGIP